MRVAVEAAAQDQGSVWAAASLAAEAQVQEAAAQAAEAVERAGAVRPMPEICGVAVLAQVVELPVGVLAVARAA
jgi:hypothetical protein